MLMNGRGQHNIGKQFFMQLKMNTFFGKKLKPNFRSIELSKKNKANSKTLWAFESECLDLKAGEIHQLGKL